MTREARTHPACEAVAAARATGDRAGEARALLDLGKFYAAVGLSVEATAAFEAAVTVARQLGDRSLVGRSLANAGSQLHQSGQFEEAWALSRQAVAEFQAHGDDVGTLRALANCAVIERAAGRAAEALHSTERALALAHRLDDRVLLVGLHALHADLLLAGPGRIGDARRARQAAAEAARRLPGQAPLADQLEGLGELALLERRHDDALTAYAEAAELHRRRGDLPSRYRTLLQVGLIHHHGRRWFAAEAALAEALELCRRTGDLVREPYVQAVLASAVLALGAFDEAARLAEEALRGYRANGDPVGTGRVLATLALAREGMGRADDGRATLVEALELLDGVDEAGAHALRDLLRRTGPAEALGR